MFSAELSGHDDAALLTAGNAAFAILRDLITRGIAAGQLRADPHGTHALAAWSLVHGLGTLVLDGKVRAAAGDPTLAALTDRVAAALIEGLAGTPSRAAPADIPFLAAGSTPRGSGIGSEGTEARSGTGPPDGAMCERR